MSASSPSEGVSIRDIELVSFFKANGDKAVTLGPVTPLPQFAQQPDKLLAAESQKSDVPIEVKASHETAFARHLYHPLIQLLIYFKSNLMYIKQK